MTILHQIWFDLGNGSEPPSPNGTESFLRENDLEHRLWRLEDAEKTISQSEKYARLWTLLPHGICRADVFRYILMYEFGGAYFDFDFCCTRSISPLLIPGVAFVAEEWPASLVTGSLHNGALVCKDAKHPFWLDVLEQIYARLLHLRDEDHLDIQKSVFQLTGTAMLRDVAINYMKKKSFFHPLIVLPFGCFCPFLNHDGEYISRYERASQVPLKNMRFPTNTPKLDSHTFAFIMPSIKTWQKKFECKKNTFETGP